MSARSASCGCSTTPCGCCACLAGAGHLPELTNRPGLSALNYRIGTYGTFREAMLRRLTLPVDPAQANAAYPLHALRTRETDDPAIALLDAWAIVGDVLTFYQERIANEAFLRTAMERRSVLELGNLVGYRLKPGVAASVYLTYTLDETAKTIIPAGTKAQTIPGANELPQTFETSEDTEARGAWNAVRPRMSRPQDLTLDDDYKRDYVLTIPSLWTEGTTARFNARDPLLFVFEAKAPNSQPMTIYVLRRVLKTNSDLEHKRTEIVLEPMRPFYLALVKEVRATLANLSTQGTNQNVATALQAFLQHVLLGVSRGTLIEIATSWKRNPAVKALANFLGKAPDDDPLSSPAPGGVCNINDELLRPLRKARGLTPATSWQRQPSLAQALGKRSDYLPRLLTTFHPQLGETLYTAIANINCGDRPYVDFRGVHVLRSNRAVFGYNAPTVLFEERPQQAEPGGGAAPVPGFIPVPSFVQENGLVLNLDMPDEAIAIGSYVVAQNMNGGIVAKVLATDTGPRTAYGISGKTTKLTLSDPWWPEKFAAAQANDKESIASMVANLVAVRSTAVLAESEELTLSQRSVDRLIGLKAEEPATDSESETRIELDSVLDGLAPGRWVVITGERQDTGGTSGVVASELAMIDNIEQRVDVAPGGTAYSILTLASAGLAYQYKRESVTISANVVHATHGETRTEILGAGDAAQPLQTFKLHQSPLTFVSAPTMTGIASTLAVRVNDVLWHEVDTLNGALPTSRVFVSAIGDDGKVRVTFGNGREGARAPSGPDNIRARYRTGLGRNGNARSKQIATAISRPLGIRDVVNPLAASGGADPESRDDARRSIPVSLQAMERVVSVQDYADFACTFAGVSKASATALSDGRRRLVHLTIGGTGDIEIDINSDLYRNLDEAIRKYGDPYQPFVVDPCEKMVIAGAARVRVDPDYLWQNVAPKIRDALVDTFSYDRREFARPVYPAEVVTTIQNVPGVVYVDLDALGSLTATDVVNALATQQGGPPGSQIVGVNPILPQLARSRDHLLHPAQIAYLPPDIADLLVLTEITHD
jgi:hypothetical protein